MITREIKVGDRVTVVGILTNDKSLKKLMDPNCTGEVTRIRKGYDIENHGTIEIKGSLGIEHFCYFGWEEHLRII